MAYFHSIANGRRRKTAILSLEDEGIVIEDKDQLRVHITEFYKTLFGKTPPSEVSLHPSIWAEQGHVTKEECNELVKPFSIKEIESAISEMKNNTAPGPDGFPVQYYKEFWIKLRDILRENVGGFVQG